MINPALELFSEKITLSQAQVESVSLLDRLGEADYP
jgi:hypothetical protein